MAGPLIANRRRVDVLYGMIIIYVNVISYQNSIHEWT
jgi:hypothetical protein